MYNPIKKGKVNKYVKKNAKKARVDLMFTAAVIKCIIVLLKTLNSIRVSVLLLKTSQNPPPTLTGWLFGELK